jgi:pyridoxal/pyridoxine/pyridoxamine kinase
LEIVEHDILDASKPLEAKQAPIITPNQGARELVTDDEMSELVELADVLKEAVTEDPAFARQIVISANLEEAQKLALWTLLDSKTRAALKKKD